MSEGRDVKVKIAVAEERIYVLQRSMADVEKDVAELKTAAERRVGGYIVAGIIGTSIGGLVSLWDKIQKVIN